MTGGLINIVSYGTQDIYLTGTPQISYFKIVYRRHTNFTMESIELAFDDEVGFDTVSNKILPPIGDLVNKVYLKIEIPEISFNRMVNQKDITDANNKYFLAQAEYKRWIAFMAVNANAYRGAIDVYNASNIIFSAEMVDTIKEIFNSYSTDTYVQNAVTYFSSNSPIWYISPQQFNILLIANSIPNPHLYPKAEFKRLLDDAISYSSQIQTYYETLIKTTYANRLDVANKNFKFAWVDKLGHAIIDYIQIDIGGEKIDKHYGDWLNIWYELAGKKDLDSIYMKMIGNVPSLTFFDRTVKPAYTLLIPLQFWFNRFNGLAIPLVALQYHEVTISIKLKKFKNCAYIEDMRTYTDANYKESIDLDDLFEENNYSINASLLVDYIYIDGLERRRFAQSSHEYLIDQLQVFDIKDIDRDNIQIRIDFNNPCKELIWVLQKDAYVDNYNGFIKSRWDNYSKTVINQGLNTKYAALEFNGYTRISKSDGKYFNYLQPLYCHSNTPSDGINVYSFSLRPEEQQPTGSCNFSRISKSFFSLWIDPNMFLYYATDNIDTLRIVSQSFTKTITEVIVPIPTTPPLVTPVTFRMYTLSSNVLRIISGIAGTAYV
jgi:hypothetical protein